MRIAGKCLFGTALLAAGAARAAPIDFECDVPPNRASIVDQKVPGPAATLTGKLSFMLARGGRFSPSSTIKVGNADDAQSVALQMVGTEPADYKTAAAQDQRYSVFLLTKTAKGTERAPLGKLSPTSADLPFTVSVAADGSASAAIGTLAGKARIAPLVGPTTRLLCSSGQFGFHGVEAR